jgi:hypothetical protein
MLDDMYTAAKKSIQYKLTVAQLVGRFPIFYVILRFIALFVGVHRWSLFWVGFIQSAPLCPVYLTCILLIYSMVPDII